MAVLQSLFGLQMPHEHANHDPFLETPPPGSFNPTTVNMRQLYRRPMEDTYQDRYSDESSQPRMRFFQLPKEETAKNDNNGDDLD